jgi:hypothetical protein
LLAGFWFRLSYLLGELFFDEFISMLAAQMVAQRGCHYPPAFFTITAAVLLSGRCLLPC